MVNDIMVNDIMVNDIMVNDIMVNDHVGPKGNRLKVWGIAFETIACLKIGCMAWKKRIGQTLETCLSAGGNEHRDAGVSDKHYLSVVIKTRRSIKEIHYQF